ncbi:tRNA (guanosine(46)-N7)-methyltransferase TrmB [Nakamurella antarctica]|uniref:tRNA (guanine-N(7)-)-methyltransferase n=1 Tax=Nakamurella antarctica TaxID=1902245 RepID=A0A3G8ZXK5_9ACTN|nr:tRNA (guanosine(46)-N7)-methyltransferase TrmB [Nakamurella antarctica]AZI59154.1 tRNA (guanosine(46)-N7)-methyltransferase TrmB [Nakamurella antarctica]
MSAPDSQDTRITPLTVPDDGMPQHFRRVVSFHPRGGRLNPVQRRSWDTHADAWYIEASDVVEGGFNAPEHFGRNAPLIVEIGSGMGEATAGMAANRPDINVLAIEVYKPGVAQTFYHLAKAGVENVRVMRGDAVEILEVLIKAGSVAEIWLFFPDPWPKTKHLKRRLVNPEFAALVASRLTTDGIFRLGTDWEPYAEQMMEVISAEPTLTNMHDGFAPRPAFRPQTRFERRGVTAGRAIFDLEFQRREL